MIRRPIKVLDKKTGTTCVTFPRQVRDTFKLHPGHDLCLVMLPTGAMVITVKKAEKAQAIPA